MNNVHLIRSLSRAYIYIISMGCIILIDILEVNLRENKSPDKDCDYRYCTAQQSFHSLPVSGLKCCRVVHWSSIRRRYRYTTVNVMYLFLLMVCYTTLQQCDSNIWNEWKDSKHLSSWYTPHDLCVMRSTLRNVSIDAISSQCEDQVKTVQTTLLPQRCRVGIFINALIVLLTYNDPLSRE